MILRHQRHQVARVLAAAIAATALAAPPAVARVDPPATPAFNSRGAEATGTVKSESGQANTPIVVRTVDDGFDWGAAAIGAGGAGLLIALASLAAVANTSRARGRVAP